MIVFYHTAYNINLGFLNRLHPFDGLKFEKVFLQIQATEGIKIQSPDDIIGEEVINAFADSLLKLLLKQKRYILRALELPYIPLVPFSWIDSKILKAMRWGVAGTIEAAKIALGGKNCWNLSGGYHHASQAMLKAFVFTMT